MNKPIQILEPSNLFTPDTPSVINTGPQEGSESSFSSILSRSKGEPDGTEDGQSLPVSGNKLPEQQTRVDDQQHVDGGSSAVAAQTDASAESHANGEPIPVAGMDLPGQPGGAMVPQQPLVPDALVNEAVAPVNAEGVSEPSLAVAPVNAEGVTEPSLNAADAPMATSEGQQLQLQAQMVDIRLLARMAPDPLSLANGQVRPGMVDDATTGAGGVNAAYLLPAEAARVSSDMAPVANVVREAVQFVMAGQTSGGDLKQFMQQNWNNQTAGNLLPAANSVETNAVPFLQTLSDSVLTTPAARVQVPVGQPGWGEAVGQQVTWFVSQKISAASLRLNPQHLGPMELAVRMDGDQASISFTSQHSMVRDALESAIPRLREMLSENGLNLADVNVSQQGKSQGDDQGAPGSRQGAGVTNTNDEANELVSGQEVRRITVNTQILIDYYA